jgi:hypothetical protein
VKASCWWCGIEPDELVEVRYFGGAVRHIPNWPPGDHRHAQQPPSADQLTDEALRMMDDR